MKRILTAIGITACLCLILGTGPLWAGYVDNGDGTVTDTSTGLTWQKDTPEDAANWEQALAYCESLSLGGHTDWRLPDINELRSLVDYSMYDPAVHVTYFPDTLSLLYWSSTTSAINVQNAWCISFFDGGGKSANKTILFRVRAVRGGNAPSTPCTPDVKANGEDGPLTVSAETPVSITVGLAPGGEVGKNADWWVAVAGFGQIFSLTPTGWATGIHPWIQYPLVALTPVQIFSGPLPVGSYVAYFGVDTTPDDILDEPLYYDYVEIHVVP